jgi:predicted ATPase
MAHVETIIKSTLTERNDFIDTLIAESFVKSEDCGNLREAFKRLSMGERITPPQFQAIVNTMSHMKEEASKTVSEESKPDLDVRPGQVKAVPGKALWKAKNRRGTAKVFKNTAAAQKFASESMTYQNAFDAGLVEFNVTAVNQVTEDNIQKFFLFVDQLYSSHKGAK